jgi:hypothetical protein
MGNSLHNKIYLGRHPRFGTRRLKAALVLGSVMVVSAVWLLAAELR